MLDTGWPVRPPETHLAPWSGMVRTHHLVGLAVAALAVVAQLAQGQPPLVELRDAALWEGQEVAVEGVVRDLRRDAAGPSRFDLVANGAALATRIDGASVQDGDPVRVTGRLGRQGGALTLFAERLSATTTDEAVHNVPLSALAQRPEDWLDRAVRVEGVVERGWLRTDGHAVQLGDGAWPSSGTVDAAATLRYHAPCACYRLDRVQAWTG